MIDSKYILASFLVLSVSAKLMELTREGHSFTPTPLVPSRDKRDTSNVLPEFFFNKEKLKIHYKQWPVPAGTQAVGMVILVHGLGEHIARYESVAKHLNSHGFIVYGLDHQGHGRSEGDRLYIKEFKDYVDDVLQLVNEVALKDHPEMKDKLFILGHSMGGAITASLILESQDLFRGCVLSAPAIEADPATAPPWKQSLAKAVGKYLPRLQLDPIPPEFLSKEAIIVDWYVNDPLIVKSPMPARLAGELLTAMDNIMTNAHKVKIPVLILHGEDDRIVIAEGSKSFHEKVSSKDKAIHILKTLKHEIFNEKETPISIVSQWLKSKL